MIAFQSGQENTANKSEATAPGSSPAPLVFACVDATRRAQYAVAQAHALSRALGGELALIRVLEPPSNREVPVDPVEWALRRRESAAHLGALAQGWRSAAGDMATALLEGQVAESLCAWAREHAAGLLVIALEGSGEAREAVLGRVARGVLENAPGPVLLAIADVEAAGSAQGPQAFGYRRVAVPLDGSSSAERALPLAIRIAVTSGAELLLLHAVPAVELTRASPPEPDDSDLASRLHDRNRRVAKRYLDRIAARATAHGITVGTRILSGGDPRHLLARAAAEEKADLMVLTTHGCGGHPDVAAGSVASYLMGHTRTPLLVVPPHDAAERRRADPARLRDELRLPDGVVP